MKLTYMTFSFHNNTINYAVRFRDNNETYQKSKLIFENVIKPINLQGN